MIWITQIWSQTYQTYFSLFHVCKIRKNDQALKWPSIEKRINDA